MDTYVFNGYQPYQQPQAFLGSPYHSLQMYQPPNMTPYALPNDYMTPHLSQIYLQAQPVPSIQPSFVNNGGLPPYGHPLYDEEPSCFESFLESFCCCFGFGVPKNYLELMQKRETQHRRLIAKEERNRLAQFQKMQEKQRQNLQQQLAMKSNSGATTATGATKKSEVA